MPLPGAKSANDRTERSRSGFKKPHMSLRISGKNLDVGDAFRVQVETRLNEAMKKYSVLFILFIAASAAFSQDDPKTMHETAKTFMRSGDFDNAVIVLTRALQQDKKNLEMQKDLLMSYYLKRDYVRARE